MSGIITLMTDFGLSDGYVAPGELVALVGSQGYLELAVREGSAPDRVGAVVGTEVILDRPQSTPWDRLRSVEMAASGG